MSDPKQNPTAYFSVAVGGVVTYVGEIPEIKFIGTGDPGIIRVSQTGTYDLRFDAISGASFNPKDIEWQSDHPGVTLIQGTDPTQTFTLKAQYPSKGISGCSFKILMDGGPANDPSIAIDPPGLVAEE